MDLNRLIPAVAKGDQTALREIYESYRTPFYYVARSIVKNEAAALSVAAEAFRRIRDSAYRFDEELNAEYCLLDVLFTLSYNKISSHDTEKENTEVPYLPEILKQEPEVFVKVFTDLGNNEIAMLVGKRKSTVSKLFAEKKDLLKSVKRLRKAAARIIGKRSYLTHLRERKRFRIMYVPKRRSRHRNKRGTIIINGFWRWSCSSFFSPAQFWGL